MQAKDEVYEEYHYHASVEIAVKVSNILHGKVEIK